MAHHSLLHVFTISTRLSNSSFVHFLNNLAGDRAQAANLAVDPADVIGNASINAWLASTSATFAEADNTLQNVSLTTWEDQWSARVTLARVLGTIRITSAQHFSWRNQHAAATVVRNASVAVHNWDADLHQNPRRVVRALASVSPSSNSSLSIIRNRFARLRQASWLNSLRELDWFFQFDDGNVVEGCSWIISFVKVFGDATDYLLTVWWRVEVVGASQDSQAADSVVYAVSSSDNDIGFFPAWAHADQSGAAEVSTVLLQADDPWMRARANLYATNDALVISVSDAIWTHLLERFPARA